jgi:hypothetical protein
MNAMDAAFLVAHEYPGGAKALGERMGMTDLSDRVNPNLSHRILGLQQAVMMQLLAKDYRVLYAMALELNHLPPVPLPEGLAGSEVCHQTMSALALECGALMAEVVHDLSDNKVTTVELNAARRKWATLVATGQQLLQQMSAMNAALIAQAPGEVE